jgi:hypothetical protein
MMKEFAPYLALTFIGPQMSKLISCNGLLAFLALPNGNLVAFLVRQYSQTGNYTSINDPKKLALVNLCNRSCPMCSNLACQFTRSLLLVVLELQTI